MSVYVWLMGLLAWCTGNLVCMTVHVVDRIEILCVCVCVCVYVCMPLWLTLTFECEHKIMNVQTSEH